MESHKNGALAWKIRKLAREAPFVGATADSGSGREGGMVAAKGQTSDSLPS